MTTTKNFNLRMPLKLRDEAYAAARFRKQPINQLICEAISEFLNSDTATTVLDTDTPPLLLRLFGDDTRFDILEWTSDEPGKGETTMQVGARVRGGTVRMIDLVLAHPACPLNTRSDFVRDAILTLLYVAAKGRLGDDRIADYARREKRLARTAAAQERFRYVRALLRELQTDLDSVDRDKNPEAAGHIYKMIGDLMVENVPQELTPTALETAKEAWEIVPDGDYKWELGAKYIALTMEVLG